MIKQEKNCGQTYRYAMIFIYGEQTSQVLEFEANQQLASRNEALENYFMMKNQSVYLKAGSKQLPIQGITAIRMEERKAELASLFALPEAPTIAQLATTIPEKEEHAVQAKLAFEITQLKALRSEAELTQKEVSELTGIDRRKLSRLERNQAQATPEELSALQTVFDSYLIEKSNQLTASTQEINSPKPQAFPRKEVKINTEDSFGTTQQIAPIEAVTGDREELEPKNDPDEWETEPIAAVIEKKQLFAKKAKKEKNKKKIPKGNRSVSKAWRGVLWTGIAVLGTSGLLAFFQASSARSLSIQAEAGVAKIQNQLENPVEVEDMSLKLDNYVTNFLNSYMTIDPTDSQQRQERDAALALYFSEPNKVATSSQYKRTLLHSQLYELEESNQGYIVTYLVQYTVEANDLSARTEIESEQKLEVQHFEQLITLRIMEQEGIFAIEEMPSFSAVPNQMGIVDFVENPMAGEQSLNTENAAPIQQFVEQFLTNYAQSPLEDMQYLMKEPQSLNGEFTYESSVNQIYEQEDGTYLVKTTVVFELKDTDIRHEERMTLVVGLKDDKYFVEDLTHTFAE